MRDSDLDAWRAIDHGERCIDWAAFIGHPDGADYLTQAGKDLMSQAADDLTAFFGPSWLDRAMQPHGQRGPRISQLSVASPVLAPALARREILGIDVASSEDGAGWLAFLRGLVARGLSGVQLVTSDCHRGLRDAIASVLPGAAWQRCRTHYHRNLLSRVPKSARPGVSTLVRTIFEQPDAASVRGQHAQVVQALETKFPAACAHLDEARDDILAFTAFPREVWRQVWSNNLQERLNKEVRRRTGVVGIFPGRDAIMRLAGAVRAGAGGAE